MRDLEAPIGMIALGLMGMALATRLIDEVAP
jgi:6-phosphogluconate dehydrogenase (decarboxylating)